jgi:hypothetical protein
MTLPNYTAPIGTEAERASGKIWPGSWFDATGYARHYRIGQPNEAYHTGADLNCNTPVWDSDAHSGDEAILRPQSERKRRVALF